MHQSICWPSDKAELYPLLSRQLAALIEDCPPVSALSNAAALLWEALPDINWAGFYLLKGQTLHLGPFQGKTACTLIPVGRGVCGTAAASREIQLVKDVHQFPGHIACDSASNSEIVLPLIKDGVLLGVMDIDAPILGRFDEADASGLNALCTLLMDQVDWSEGLL
ncbi:MAG: GAF domain-containing protein [Clostridia bacterium]|nr:GAF domain-containing protein [Clostridia bacterium]